MWGQVVSSGMVLWPRCSDMPPQRRTISKPVSNEETGALPVLNDAKIKEWR